MYPVSIKVHYVRGKGDLVVTSITGFEPFVPDCEKLADELQKKCASSVSGESRSLIS